MIMLETDNLSKTFLLHLQGGVKIDVLRNVDFQIRAGECVALTGEMDYLLRLLVRDMAHYSQFIMNTLLKHPSVQDCKTSFVMDRVKSTTAVPL